jgi:predicted enzyme related to lactoylglutathione lyase
MSTKKATGIGGIFFKCKNPDEMKEWYGKHLGLNTDEYGAMFEFRKTENPEQKGYLQWSPFPENTEYFKPSKKDFMINYRVENLEKLLEELSKEGVEIVGKMETFEYGKFAHIIDPEGNKIELWEPVDEVFTKSDECNTTH